MSGQSPNEIDRAFPTVEDGVKGLAFVKATSTQEADRLEMPNLKDVHL